MEANTFRNGISFIEMGGMNRRGSVDNSSSLGLDAAPSMTVMTPTARRRSMEINSLFEF